MRIVDVVARAKAIMLTPQTEWQVIQREPGALTDLFGSYVAILAAIPAIARFIGSSLIGGYDPPFHGMIRTVIAYAATFTVVYVIAGVIDLLARRFGTQKNFPGALKLSIYCHTPVWLAGVFLLISGLEFSHDPRPLRELSALGRPAAPDGCAAGECAALRALRHRLRAALDHRVLGDLARAHDRGIGLTSGG